jgi:endoglucanase
MRENAAKPRGNVFVLLLAALVAACLVARAAHAETTGEAKFRRGIGISHVMMWAPLEPAPSKNFVFPPFTYSDATFAGELKTLRRTGFDFVRFAVDPGPFLQWDGPRRDELTRKLVNTVRLILSHDLSVIVDFHPSDMHPDYLGTRIAAGPDAPMFKDYLRLLTRTAASLNALQSSQVALELMNEPPPRASAWKPMLDLAYAAVRKAAPKLLLVLDGGEEGNLDGTITLDGYRDDPNVLFSFHYYRPWQFTHQGMAGMAAQYLTDVPYPARARPMDESIAASVAAMADAKLAPSELSQTKTKGRRDLEGYRASSFDRSHIARDFDRVARWAREHSVPAQRVILGEFGVMDGAQRPGAARQADRLRWLSDVREEAEARGFAWAAWVHSGSIGFSLVEREGSTELDPGVLHALGFEKMVEPPRVTLPAAPVR